MLTEAEHEAMRLTAELVGVVCQQVISSGPTFDQDVAEFVAMIHPIQRMILAQGAARMYPERYRLLGLSLPEAAQ